MFFCLKASDPLWWALPLPSGPGSSGWALCLDPGLWASPGIHHGWEEALALELPGPEVMLVV